MELNKFFQDNIGPYRSNAVEMVYSEDDSIHLASNVPGLAIADKSISVSLFSEHDSLGEFCYEYLITEINDLNLITPEIMLKRF